MAGSSFDIVSRVDLQEFKNALQQAAKEMATRFDLKGTKAEGHLEGETALHISVADETKINAVRDVIEGRLVKRGVPLKALSWGEVEKALGGTARQKAELQQGIPVEKAREIVKRVKQLKLKVQAQINGDQVRIVGKKRDDLQPE